MRTKTAGFVLCAVVLAPAFARADVDLGTRASHMIAAMEGDAHRVAVLLRSARASRVPAPIRCVNAYLNQVDTDVRHGREDIADLRAALASGDLVGAMRAMGWLTSRREAARSASFAADACVMPSVATERDRTTVHVVVDPKLPPDRAVFVRR